MWQSFVKLYEEIATEMQIFNALALERNKNRETCINLFYCLRAVSSFKRGFQSLEDGLRIFLRFGETLETFGTSRR